jgi:Peptidase A4 family
MWYEIYPQQSEQRVTDFPVAANDVVGAEAGYDPPSRQSVFRLYNFTKGNALELIQPVTTSGFGSGSTAEWIVERPAVCATSSACSFPPLTNFGTEPIQLAQAITGQGASDPNATVRNARDLNPNAISMWSCDDRTLLADPAPFIDIQDFSVVWRNHGILDPPSAC